MWHIKDDKGNIIFRSDWFSEVYLKYENMKLSEEWKDKEFYIDFLYDKEI